MNKKLKKHWLRLEQSKAYYDALSKVFNEAQLNFKPDENSWSMMQVMHHLYISEKLSITFVKNFDFGRKLVKLGLKSQLKTILLVNRLESKRKLKVPKILSEKAADYQIAQGAHAFQQQWNELREELRDVLINFPYDKLDYFVFNQPVTGKMKLAQMLQFFRAHLNHHKHQIEAINHHKNFPV